MRLPSARFISDTMQQLGVGLLTAGAAFGALSDASEVPARRGVFLRAPQPGALAIVGAGCIIAGGVIDSGGSRYAQAKQGGYSSFRLGRAVHRGDDYDGFDQRAATSGGLRRRAPITIEAVRV